MDSSLLKILAYFALGVGGVFVILMKNRKK
jgi:hypothetical protein